MRRMQEDMDRIFSQFFGGEGDFGELQRAGQAGLQQWAPSVDFSRAENEYRIEAELPGVRPEDVDVQVRDNHLILRAEMRSEEGEPRGGAGQGDAGQQREQQGQGSRGERQYLHRERRYGFFQRVIPLPEDAEEEGISCEFENGVLTVHLPRSARSRQEGRRIPVTAGSTRSERGNGRAGNREPALAGSKGGEATAPEQQETEAKQRPKREG
jgi:HSP20 family protein